MILVFCLYLFAQLLYVFYKMFLQWFSGKHMGVVSIFMTELGISANVYTALISNLSRDLYFHRLSFICFFPDVGTSTLESRSPMFREVVT